MQNENFYLTLFLCKEIVGIVNFYCKRLCCNNILINLFKHIKNDKLIVNDYKNIIVEFDVDS